MAESSSTTPPSQPAAQNAAPKPSAPPKPQNPAFRMMGLPNFRFKLPSRNWLIFLSITGSFTTALLYDRRETRRVQEKWSNLVAHIAKEPIPNNQTRRKLTVIISAPPGDGLRSAREFFKDYVKPVLVSGAMDYEVIEGRKEGEVRAALANKIRKLRRQAGEGAPLDEESDSEALIKHVRNSFGIHDEPVVKGDLVLGRHTWKEYIRGLHEGWLGPLDPPLPPPPPPSPEADTSELPTPEVPAVEGASPDDGSPVAQPEEPKEQKEPEPEKKPEETKKPKVPTPAYIYPSDYPSQPLPPTLPQELNPSLPVPFPHILGFLNTPIRLYRFLTQRYLADQIGHDIAAIVLANSIRPFNTIADAPNPEFTPDESSPSSPDPSSSSTSHTYEQQTVLTPEEKSWHKSVHKKPTSSSTDSTIELPKEREWLDEIVIDPRLNARMRTFYLSPDDEERAKRILAGEEWVLGEEMPAPYPLWKRMWDNYGFGENPEHKSKVVLGNIDDEDA
ncbi:hypothetical protein AJ80_09784 [Polytolypa hystricis UAMH7299]|uniref:Mitochondrial import inner membrane translocase subunit TIM54 n=1 Tax=Polytolypa hystricis (strain UAMH7299) TaxID=1447883 RepID=A0A2B7WJS1_POLH7|nr:hypothetical protein AJ80_09784 [Polytolypa hystricis UAMH7299]